jgi:hypothetical protein
MIIKNLFDPHRQEYKFIYILAGLNKDKIKTKMTKEEIDKLILNDEKQVLYGTVTTRLILASP